MVNIPAYGQTKKKFTPPVKYVDETVKTATQPKFQTNLFQQTPATNSPFNTLPKPPGMMPAAPRIDETISPYATLSQTADKMKTARESGDLGTLSKMTQDYKTQIGEVTKGIPIDVYTATQQANQLAGTSPIKLRPGQTPAARLSELARQMQQMREMGNFGQVQQMLPEYEALTAQLKGQVTPAGPAAVAQSQWTEAQKAAWTAANPPQADARGGFTQATPPWLQGQPPPATAAAEKAAPAAMPPAPGMEAQAGQGMAPEPTAPPPVTPEQQNQAIQQAQSRIQEIENQIRAAYSIDRENVDEGRIRALEQERATLQQQLDAGTVKPKTEQELKTRRDMAQRAIEASRAGQGLEWARSQFPEFYGMPDAEVERHLQQYVDEYEGQYGEEKQWTDRLNQILDRESPEIKQQIENLPEVLKNEYYREAIDTLKAGGDPSQIFQKYKDLMTTEFNFELGKPGFQMKEDYGLHDYTKVGAPEIKGEEQVKFGTETGGIESALSGMIQSAEGKAALTAAYNALTQRLQSGGGMTTDEIRAYAKPFIDEIDAQTEKSISAAGIQAGAMGLGSTGTTVTNATAIRQEAANKKKQLYQDLVMENMRLKSTGLTEATAQLTQLAGQESAAALEKRKQDIEAQTGMAELKSREAIEQQKAQLAQKALFQEGQLTVYGQQVQENLGQYGMQLEKYSTDKGIDFKRLELDYQERATQAGLDVEEAKAQAKQVTDAIQFAMDETEMDDKRNQAVASLEQAAAQGDQDAQFKITALRVEQELRGIGLSNDWAGTIGQIVYGLKSGKMQLDQDMKKFLMGLAAQVPEETGFMDFLGQVLGTGAGLAATAIVAG